MKKYILIAFSLFTSSFLLNSCATVFGGGITACQKQKPSKGEPKRKIRPIAFVGDIVIGEGIGLIVDFANGSIYRPCNVKYQSKSEWIETVEIKDVSKDKLFQRSLEWFNDYFRNMKAVIQDKDKEAGTFYGKGAFSIYKVRAIPEYVVNYSVNIAVKNGKYKYQISLTNFNRIGTGINKKQWQKIEENASLQIEAAITSLKDKMSKESISETF